MSSYKANAEHWADIEAWVKSDSKASTDHCMLELRQRIEALEAKPNVHELRSLLQRAVRLLDDL